MLGQQRRVRYLAAILVLAVAAALVPFDAVGATVRAFDGCTVTDDVRGTSCRLLPGEAIDGVLDAASTGATYRIDAFSPDAALELVLAAQGRAGVSVLDWNGQTLGAADGEQGPEVRLSAKLPLPGAYAVRVSNNAPGERANFRLTADVTYPAASAQPVWPPALLAGDGPIGSERQAIRVPRGGTPTGGVAASRILGAPPKDVFGDFTLTADVRFEKIVGPAALTVRFRFEPEAGGGTGYVLSLDPFGGTATLDTFDEGQRHTILGDVPLGLVPSPDATNRLVLSADGPAIRATLDGQPVLEASDTRFTRGLIAVGAVTWSDPVAVTFDHIQVTTPPR